MKQLLGAAIIVVVITFIAAMYFAGRHINYSLAYEDLVKETVRETVKSEALRTER